VREAPGVPRGVVVPGRLARPDGSRVVVAVAAADVLDLGPAGRPVAGRDVGAAAVAGAASSKAETGARTAVGASTSFAGAFFFFFFFFARDSFRNILSPLDDDRVGN